MICPKLLDDSHKASIAEVLPLLVVVAKRVDQVEWIRASASAAQQARIVGGHALALSHPRSHLSRSTTARSSGVMVGQSRPRCDCARSDSFSAVSSVLLMYRSTSMTLGGIGFFSEAP